MQSRTDRLRLRCDTTSRKGQLASRHAGGRDRRRDGGLNYFERRRARVRREGEKDPNWNVTERLIERGKEDIRDSLEGGQFHCPLVSYCFLDF